MIYIADFSLYEDSSNIISFIQIFHRGRICYKIKNILNNLKIKTMNAAKQEEWSWVWEYSNNYQQEQ